MKKAKVEIDLDELKREVKDFMLSIERDRITPKPVQRIGEIIEAMRRFKMAVVKANVPRGLGTEKQTSREEQNGLRQHRLAHQTDPDPDTGIPALRDRLKKLDCAFLLGGELYWRLDDSDWEAGVWKPIHEWVQRGYAMLFSGSGDKDWPRPVEAAVLSAWEAEEQGLESRLFERMSTFIPEPDLPVIDPDEQFTIRWRGYPCYLGDNDSFRIMRRIIEAKNRMASREEIGLAIGSDYFTDEALRQAASRLKKKLKEAGLGELAARLKTTENGKYVYLDQTGLTRPGRV
jgi:hypothetical protein